MTERLTSEHIKSFLAKHKDPAKARRFLQEVGLIDKDGELSKTYRPDKLVLASPMDELRQASADVSSVELDLNWVQKAGKAKLREKAQAIVDAVDKALWENNPRFNAEYRAASAALLEAINQTQNGQGMVSAADLHLIAMEMKKL